MKRILFLADQSQRIKSQLNLIRQLLEKQNTLDITLFITCEVDEKLLTNMGKVKAINLHKKSTLSKKVKQNNFLYKFVKDSLIGQIAHTIILLKTMRKYYLLANLG